MSFHDLNLVSDVHLNYAVEPEMHEILWICNCSSAAVK